MRGAFYNDLLGQETHGKLLRRLGVRPRRTQSPAELLSIAKPVIEEWRARPEEGAEVVERWREEAGRDGRATSGWAPHARGSVRRAGRPAPVPQDGEATRGPATSARRAGDAARWSPGSCPLDGTPAKKAATTPRSTSPSTRRSTHGGSVQAGRKHRHDLEPVEGIGALLRF